MREYALTLTYDRGVDPVMDAFIDYPEAIAKAITISVSRAGLWRVDRIAGPEEALSTLEAAFMDPDRCNECVGLHPECEATREYHVVVDEGTNRTVYSRLKDVRNCHSVPYLATVHLGEGIAFDAQRRGDRYEWRLLVPDGRRAGELFDALHADLPAGIAVELGGVGTPSYWGENVVTVADLPYEQREALETAVAMGYYGTPRGATLAGIADELGIPASTLRYRLRRAESWLTTRFVEGNSMLNPAGKGPSPTE